MFLKIVGIILAVVVLFFAVTSLITIVGKNSNMKKIESFEQVKIENRIVPVEDENGYWTFTTDKDFKVVIQTLEGEVTLYDDCYVIKGIKGEFYPCQKEIFEATYDKVSEGK